MTSDGSQDTRTPRSDDGRGGDRVWTAAGNRSVIFFELVLFVIRNLNLYLSLWQLSVSSLLSVLHIVILYFTVNL